MPDRGITPVTDLPHAIMTTSIPLESDSLSPPLSESLPCPMAVECRVTMRNSPVCGLMNVISVSVLLLADLLLRGVTFFFCPMLMDVVDVGHLICFETHNLTIGVLHVFQVINRTTHLSLLLRCMTITFIVVSSFLSDPPFM
ncbi:hypothetical protein EV401DRAFT_1457681 [Pisolithus croceorrhizus]|nr:hypothetical protein EV401DRAFT_1457681 [Pisolithus croceorrhizus]